MSPHSNVLIPIVILTVFPVYTYAQITFSEIMYDVSTNEYHDEFIEIFNLSYDDSIECCGWTFSDSFGIDVIQSYHGGMKIAPRRYALILDGSYFNNSTTYDTLFSDSLVILKIGDNSFGKNGLSNSIPERLTLRDSTGTILAEYTYSIGNKPGYSDEKIDLDGSNLFTNWSESKRDGGTPGSKNSVSPPTYDFGFKDDSFIFPYLLLANQAVVFTLDIYNFGTKSVKDSLHIMVYSDLNRDKIFQTEDLLIDSQNVAATTQKIKCEWHYPPPGLHRVEAKLTYQFDEIQENNFISQDVRVFEQNVSLHINEIKFLTRDDEPEWIELVNYGKESILLYDWALADLSDTTYIDTMLYLLPGEYVIIAEESPAKFYQIRSEKMVILNKFPSLNDMEDKIFLINPIGNWTEYIHYSRHWLENEDYKYPSLERINPLLFENNSDNWGPSVDFSRATPGKVNSIFSKLNDRKSELSASPNPFSPDGDGNDDVTIISGQIPENSSRIKAEIYDIRGRLIRRLKYNNFSGSHVNITWDGRDNQGRTARIGVYIIFLQSLNDRNGLLHEMKTTVVLAQKL